MGCISSKFLATADLDREISTTHVVSLTSSTYGVLNLDRRQQKQGGGGEEEEAAASIGKDKSKRPIPPFFTPQSKKRVLSEEPAEIINTWELMKDLSDETPIWSPAMKPTNYHPLEFSMSPKKQRRRLLGKENSNSPCQDFQRSSERDANRVLRPFSSSANKQSGGPNSVIRQKNLSIDVKILRPEKDGGVCGSRRSLSPLFDPELVASFERELNSEGEQIKKMVAPVLKTNTLLQSFEEKCPPGGENALILYTTTLRGIRKTFEDCNAVRTAVEAHDVRIVERDISMDSGFREELRELMGKKEVKLPLVFVKGRLIGGAEEVLRLEEEGKLGLLLEGIAKKDAAGCGLCGGVRFVLCRDCNGSCKVLDEEVMKMVKCGECNENGLVQCPLCC